ncbi:hypothetical protein GDO86_000777 [Hymenochirus boettgeri]|uniref:Chemokine interleukin-8-like domain-containing protein n=1 Tax=Hymenochirus boettgeri TaxID=247094 RepID=A0A8T2KI69_9PIPI|nr:hypothetical protein GDO86_000777 [Hymenochirus boettgeri]
MKPSLVVISLSTALSLEPRLPGGRCKCLKQTNSAIRPNQLTRVEFFPPGRTCPKLECLVTLKNGSIVCVNPKAEWLKRLVAFFKEQSIKEKQVKNGTSPDKLNTPE